MRSCACVLLFALAAGAEDPDVILLRERGLLPTQESLRGYLRTLYPQPGSLARIERYVENLSAPEALLRDHATRMLLREGISAMPALRRSLRHDSPEVRRRARSLLDRVQARIDPAPLYAAYMTIARQGIPGLAPEVIHTLPLSREGHVRAAGQRALAATATPDDVLLLRETTQESDAGLRAAAIRALGRVLGADGREDLLRGLEDGLPHVRFAAAQSLAQIEDRRSIDALVDLLDCPDAMVRDKSVALLRGLAGSTFGYAAYASEAERRPALEAWRRWSRSDGQSVNWAVAKQEFAGAKQHIVIAIGRRPKSEIVEIDTEGRVHVRYDVGDYLQGVFARRNGNVLVSLYQQRCVAEFDPRGREVWRSQQLRDYPGSVQRLANGNTLVVLPRRGEILELDRESNTVWTASTGPHCYFARRLDSGITRAAVYNASRIIELDRSGRRTHEVVTPGQPFSMSEMPNGNLLVACANNGSVREIARDGAEKRAIGGFQWPTSAIRLPGGDIVVADRTGVHRVGRDGTRRMLFASAAVNWISYY